MEGNRIGMTDEADSAIGRWIQRRFTARRAVLVLTFILFLNYVDRGIVAGAGTSIKGCVASQEQCGDIQVPVSCDDDSFMLAFGVGGDAAGGKGGGNRSSVCEQCRVCGHFCKGELIEQTGFGINTAQLGVLQSMFMVGYMAGAVAFAQLSTKIRPFRLISLGLVLWIAASIGSGIAGWLCDTDGSKVCSSYYLMIFTRALSGVGEASMNTLTLPFLDDVLEPRKKGFYIGVYYTAIPVGTACGFMWAGIISSITGGKWEWAFFLEVPLMVPFAILTYYAPFSYQLDPSGEVVVDSRSSVGSEEDEMYVYTSLAAANSEHARRDARRREAAVKKMSLTENVWACLSRPAFVLGCLGYAFYTGVVAGLGFYGPLFLQSYRPCDARWDINQATADVVFGMIISLSGLMGTIIGGWLIDRIKANHHGQKNRNDLLKQLILQLVIGFGVSMGSLQMVLPILFFVFLFLGGISLFMVSAGINLMLMWTVPKENRPMSSALSVLAIHLFGDVPSPILIGWISDTHTPLFTLTVTICCLLGAIAMWIIVLVLPVEEIPMDDEEEDGEDDATHRTVAFFEEEDGRHDSFCVVTD